MQGAPMTAETAPRIPPLEAPYPEGIAELLARMTPPQAPEVLALFRVLAVNPRLAERTLDLGRHFLGRKASISLRERELVILRVCARCGAEYEWGVHWSGFADAAGLGEAERRATAGRDADLSPLQPRDALLLRMVDQLHDTGHIDDALWHALGEYWDHAQCLELMMLAGWYHAVSYVCNAARVPLERWAARW
ncbi:carboxymuconolactone decarboxylase [Variovorax paradoxus]|nr:carboxymuconolactone decarboxylase [Variovorax paradoxus]KPU91565.1 carboxymuconolactone decarboxylase [Variovorax paradoxus]KPV02296.1 carboxymuconolactone decarboxylase [Variovorax paradoxus]KPV11628.1 carboxymuconolactone decarboxylase [Variovorax paradoxus]KPV18881.1 carboxymuconolactone decarboxylase [Variovorax paradoxus]